MRIVSFACFLAAFFAPCVIVGASAGAARASQPGDGFAAGAAQRAGRTLVAYEWRLVDARDAAGVVMADVLDHGGTDTRLGFADIRIDGNGRESQTDGSTGYADVAGPCNASSRHYRVAGDVIDFNVEGPPGSPDVVSTLMSCGAEMDALGRRIRDFLGTLRFSIIDGPAPRLQLEDAGGRSMTFLGSPTPATRFGSAGEPLELDVGPRRVPCAHLTIPGSDCLLVRRLGSGPDRPVVSADVEPWPLRQEIEGFDHEAGMRYVIHVLRFMLPEPQRDGSSEAYVFLGASRTTRVPQSPPSPVEQDPGSVPVLIVRPLK